MGFQAEGVYVAAGNHMLKVEFIGSSGLAPVASDMPAEDGKTQPLGQVIYTDIWREVTLSYTHVAESIFQSSYLLDPNADVDQIKLCYNASVEIEAIGNLRIKHKTGQGRESAPVPNLAGITVFMVPW
jgi:hypothetical protein